MVRLGNILFKFRDVLFPAIVILFVFLTEPVIFRSDERLDLWMDILGIAIALAGQALRAATIGYAYIIRGGRNRKVYAERLVHEGIFAHCRNPLYLGNIMIVIGLTVIVNSIWFYAIAIPFFIIGYYSIIRAEEEFLRKKFGQEYEDYCRRVNELIPDFRGLGKSLEGMTFNWKRLVSKEYGTTFTWMLSAIVFMIWEKYHVFGYEAKRTEINNLALLLIPLVILYAVARFLKKTGRLSEKVEQRSLNKEEESKMKMP